MTTSTLEIPKARNYISGKFIDNGHRTMEVLSPLDGSVISSVPMSSNSDLDKAVSAAKASYPAWAALWGG